VQRSRPTPLASTPSTSCKPGTTPPLWTSPVYSGSSVRSFRISI